MHGSDSSHGRAGASIASSRLSSRRRLRRCGLLSVRRVRTRDGAAIAHSNWFLRPRLTLSSLAYGALGANASANIALSSLTNDDAPKKRPRSKSLLSDCLSSGAQDSQSYVLPSLASSARRLHTAPRRDSMGGIERSARADQS